MDWYMNQTYSLGRPNRFVWLSPEDMVLLQWADLKDSTEFKRVLSGLNDLPQLCQYVQTLFVNRRNEETPPVDEETSLKNRLIALNLEVRAHDSQKGS